MWDPRNFVIAALAACLVWFGAAIARLENYRYAASLDFCREFDPVMQHIQKQDCLAKVETRTHPIWHVLYGLRIL